MFAAMTARLAAAAAASELGLPPEAADEVLAHAQRSGIDFDNFGTERSSSEIIDAHNKALRREMQQLQQLQQQDNLFFMRASQSRDVKPAGDFPRPPPFSALSPISCQDMQLHTTHRGRLLRGKLVTDALFMTGIHSILQDEHGDGVKVSFYNTPGLQQAGNNPRRAFTFAQQLFPKGQALAIIEPFYKVATDGTRIVRVDNPSEVVFLDDLHESPEALQQQGDKHLTAHQYKEAVACYDKALLAFQQQQQQQHHQQPQPSPQAELCQMLLSVLLNLSAAHLQLRRPPALLYATAAAALSSHKSSKAYYRVAVALDQLCGGLTSVISKSSSSSGGVTADNDPALAGRLAAAATAMMEGSVSLTGNTTAAARAQIMAALTNVAAAKGKGSQAGSSRRWVAEAGEWQVVCELLSVSDDSNKLDDALASCFRSSSNNAGSSSSIAGAGSGGGQTDCAAAVSAAGLEKELGNTAFKQGAFATALQHYQAALACLQSCLGPISRLLSSRAKAWLQQPSRHSQQHAFMDGLTAALLTPKQCAEGFHTAAVALLQLDAFPGAQGWCELGLQLLPGARDLQELLRRIHAAAAVDQLGQKMHAAAQLQPSQHTAGSSSGASSSSGSSATAATSSKPQTGNGKKQGKKKASSSSSSSGGGGRPSATPMTERELKEFERRGTASVEQVSMVNQLAELAARMGPDRGGRAAGRGGRGGRGGSSSRGSGRGRGRGRGMSDALFEMIRVDERVPNLLEEFAKGGRWPPQIDVQRASRVLWEACELARALPMYMLAMVKSEAVTPEIMIKRLYCLEKERIEWLLTAGLGDVSFRKENYAYGGGWQSFVNAPSRTEILEPGTTHVAIGFVDLGGLAAACEVMAARDPLWAHCATTLLYGVNLAAAPGAADSGNSSSSGGPSSSSGAGGSRGLQEVQDLIASAGLKPLRWVGYEQSAYCVAKTLVLLQMVEQGAALDEVLQVWYSSTWSNKTLEAFRQAVIELLTTASTLSSLTPQQRQVAHPSADALVAPDVLGLLRDWQVKQVTLAAARSAWLDNAESSFAYISNFVQKADRLALTELALTGEVRALGPGDTGSVVMFSVPRKFGERAFDECFLQVQTASDIVAVGVQMLRSRARLLAGMLRVGLVKAEVRLGAVQLGNTGAISSIRSLEPYTISWSNVPDYMHPADFHKLAQAVSAPSDTVHFMHSMNWVTSVKGACHIDFMLCTPEGMLSECMADLKEMGEQAAKMMYALLGLQKLLLSPPVDNPRNVADYGLYVTFHEHYVKAFFAQSLSGMKSPECQVHVVEQPTYSILSRTNSTMHITFSYDPDIRLQGTSAFG